MFRQMLTELPIQSWQLDKDTVDMILDKMYIDKADVDKAMQKEQAERAERASKIRNSRPATQ